MANEEHLKILKQGAGVWNKWRREHSDIRVDLRDAILRDADLRNMGLGGADLRNADLKDADLRKAILKGADFSDAFLTGALLTGALLSGALLSGALLRGANLRSAILTRADLRNTDLSRGDLTGANLGRANLSLALLNGAVLNRANLSLALLNGADLSQANLSGANLGGANLGGAFVGLTTFGNNDLSTVEGLDSTVFTSPSTIGIDTLYRSGGKIPEEFLRGCGLSDWQIEFSKLHQTDLSSSHINDILYRVHFMRVHQAIQINPLFISYSHADSAFVDRLEQNLNQKGIRFWRDVHHATSGRLEKQIDRAMRLNPTVLVILSGNSVESDWVEHEVRLARSLEKELRRDVICPIALDDSWMSCSWPERLREQIMEYNILDFSEWKDDSYLERAFNKLIEGLDLFYKSEPGIEG